MARRVGERCRCCGKLRSDYLRALPSDPHRCGSAYVNNYLGQWVTPPDRFGRFYCSVSGYGPCPVQHGGKCHRQIPRPDQRFIVDGQVGGVSFRHEVDAPTRRSAIARVARILRCKATALEIDTAAVAGMYTQTKGGE